jgi:thiosulfate dehydrogenase (quinone) large subunit
MKKESLLGILRIFMGWIFLWPFFDKLFGLGFTTTPENAWLNGGSPTTGFLSFAAKGPFATVFNSLAGNIFVDWLFMLGLLLIGTSLILGIFNKLATYSGTLLLLLMYSAVLPPEHNPLLDDHIIYSLALIILLHFKAGNYLGLGKKWSKIKFVKKNKFFE